MNPLAVVLDTNVIVAAMRSRQGCSFRIIDDFMTRKPAWEWNISNSSVLEYEEVLLKEGVPPQVVDAFLADLLAKATRIRIPRNSRPLVPDPDDDVFAELALTANADYMVTFTIPAPCLGLSLL